MLFKKASLAAFFKTSLTNSTKRQQHQSLLPLLVSSFSVFFRFVSFLLSVPFFVALFVVFFMNACLGLFLYSHHSLFLFLLPIVLYIEFISPSFFSCFSDLVFD